MRGAHPAEAKRGVVRRQGEGTCGSRLTEAPSVRASGTAGSRCPNPRLTVRASWQRRPLLAALFSGRYTRGGGAASISLGSRPACEAILVETRETSLKALGVRVSRGRLVGQAKVSCHAVT